MVSFDGVLGFRTNAHRDWCNNVSCTKYAGINRNQKNIIWILLCALCLDVGCPHERPTPLQAKQSHILDNSPRNSGLKVRMCIGAGKAQAEISCV
jgi:hypothetical protein